MEGLRTISMLDPLQWKVSLPMAGGLELDDLYGPFQPKPFCDSTTLEEPGQAPVSADMVTEQILECSHTCKYSIHLVMKKDNHRAQAIFLWRLLRRNSSAVMGSLSRKPVSAAEEQKAANGMIFLEGFKGDPGNFRTLNLTITWCYQQLL